MNKLQLILIGLALSVMLGSTIVLGYLITFEGTTNLNDNVIIEYKYIYKKVIVHDYFLFQITKPIYAEWINDRIILYKDALSLDNKIFNCLILHEIGHSTETNNNNRTVANETFADDYMISKDKTCKRFYQ
jgi:hypothetical protein